MKSLSIKADYDSGLIDIKWKDKGIDLIIPVKDFVLITIEHKRTGIPMSNLIQEYTSNKKDT